jgi:hypothetical protein
MAAEGGAAIAQGGDLFDASQGRGMQGVSPTILVSPWQQEIDLSTKHGSNLWSEGTKPADEKFSGSGRDVPRFIALVKNQVSKCYLTDIVTVNGKNLLVDYGTVTLEEIKRVRDARNAVNPSSLREAQPRIKAQILFHFIYGSLGSLPLRKISTRLDEIQQDGPTLLKIVLVDTFVATQAHTFKAKEQLYDLQLKAYKHNVQSMNQGVREIMVDLQAAGHSVGNDDIMITLFRAYSGSTNDEFRNSVMYWKNEWSNGSLTLAEELMIKADSKYDELKKTGTWGRSSDKDEQIIALTAKLESLQKEIGSGQSAPMSFGSGSSFKKNKSKDAWKYDRSLSTSTTYSRDGKTYKWCSGPGHNKKPMWVCGHEPGQCTADYKKGTKGKQVIKTSMTSPHATRYDKSALTAMVKASDSSLSAIEIESKVQALLSVLES